MAGLGVVGERGGGSWRGVGTGGGSRETSRRVIVELVSRISQTPAPQNRHRFHINTILHNAAMRHNDARQHLLAPWRQDTKIASGRTNNTKPRRHRAACASGCLPSCGTPRGLRRCAWAWLPSSPSSIRTLPRSHARLTIHTDTYESSSYVALPTVPSCQLLGYT